MTPGRPQCTGVGDLTRVVRRADAHIVVDPVHAGGIVLTVVVLAIVWIDLTLLALEAQRAGAALGVCGVGRRGARGQGVGSGGGVAEKKVGGDIISQVSLWVEVRGSVWYT